MKIKKAVIPAAGFGTRFLPATKAQPKEMFPIVDKPAIQYIVEEAVNSGIESIVIVTGRNKRSIEDYFDKSIELEKFLSEKGKFALLSEIQEISGIADIHFICQKEALGLGNAILCAQDFIGDEPFAVLLGDDIMVSETPALSHLLKVYEQTGKQVVGVKPVLDSEIGKYGIIDSAGKVNGIYKVNGLVEKPLLQNAPSNVAIMGRYILKPTIFQILKTIDRGSGGEYQLTDALHEMVKLDGLLALELPGTRYDIGDKFGYIKATLEIGLQRKDLYPILLPYLEQLVCQESLKAQLVKTGIV